MASADGAQEAGMTTILIRGGRVLDGTGAAVLEADVLIEQDRIAGLLGPADGADREVGPATRLSHTTDGYPPLRPAFCRRRSSSICRATA